MMTSISVCIPTFNRKAYLRQTIESVLCQTRKADEIIIVDDGSTDGTRQMLSEAGYPVRYCWQENRGDAAARNKLIELAVGERLTFLDSDDLLMPDAIERMSAAMDREQEEVVVYGSYLAIDGEGRLCARRPRRLYSGFITQHLFQGTLVHSVGSMFPRNMLEEAGGFDASLRVCSDYDLWLRLSLTYRFVALSQPVFKRRRHSGNLSKPCAANRVTELKVLERFYWEKGGSSAVPKRIALRRLSQEAHRAGKAALLEQDLKTARHLLAKSIRWHPNVKSSFYWVWAVLAQRFTLP